MMAATMPCYATSASAAAVNFICSEKGGTEIKKSSSSGETEKTVTDLWSIPTTVDTATGRATMWGKDREMSVESAKILLREYSEKMTTTGNSTQISTLEINRRTLSFSYSWYSRTSSRIPSLGLAVSVSTTRKTNGVCTKIQEAKGNKI